jgi:hypothetical protein
MSIGLLVLAILTDQILGFICFLMFRLQAKHPTAKNLLTANFYPPPLTKGRLAVA